MKTQTLIASVASVLITSATLAIVSNSYTTDFHQTPSAWINGSKVTNLPPVNVQPTAEDLRAASLVTDASSITGLASMPTLARAGGSSDAAQFTLIGAQLAMPYYSFGNKFGRISKE